MQIGVPLLGMLGTDCVARAGFEASGNVFEESVSGAQLSITYDNCLPEIFNTNCYIQYTGTITPGNEPPPECTTSAACGMGFACASDQTCIAVPPCMNDLECGNGFVCTNGTCVAAPPSLCTGVVCATGEVCNDATGVCGPIPCANDTNCPAGFGCSGGPNGICEALPPLAYVTNLGDSTVSVIDTATNIKVTTVTVGDGPRGVTVSPDGSRVYTGNQSADTMSVIDPATNTVVATVPVGEFPAGP